MIQIADDYESIAKYLKEIEAGPQLVMVLPDDDVVGIKKVAARCGLCGERGVETITGAFVLVEAAECVRLIAIRPVAVVRPQLDQGQVPWFDLFAGSGPRWSRPVLAAHAQG